MDITVQHSKIPEIIVNLPLYKNIILERKQLDKCDNGFLFIIPPLNIHSFQAYVSNINTSDIISITFDSPYRTLLKLINIAAKISDYINLKRGEYEIRESGDKRSN
ncbi:hypothetical protein GLOIN_2v1838830 [Rhizophagus irregularis DAOM 181602=DAOM 197198]|nr:hypothetical protein GLOIN_2v1838830 [Rhizophagus irregularis DAOM 181602=DAOM 197198]